MELNSIEPERQSELHDLSEGAIRQAIDAYCEGVLQDTKQKAAEFLREAAHHKPLLS